MTIARLENTVASRVNLISAYKLVKNVPELGIRRILAFKIGNDTRAVESLDLDLGTHKYSAEPPPLFSRSRE